MAKKFLTPIDLSQLELQNARIQNLASAPSSPVKGQIYYNTTTNKAMVYNGTTWVPWEADTNTVTGVKGNSETNYRTGNVNITAANVGAAPTNHASTATTYGIGTDSNYGHVKLSDATNSTSSTSSGIAATPKAVKDALASATAYSDELEEALGSAAYKNAATSISSTSDNSSVPTSKTVYDYVGSAISAADAMIFKGGLAGTATSPGAFTPAADRGHTYVVTADGYIDGIKVEAGDMFVCKTDSTVAATSSNYTTVRDNWVFVQANIDGAVTATTTTTNGYLAKFTGNKIVANGPQLGSSTTTYLRNDGSWATPPDNDTKNTAGSTDSSSKLFLIGATTQAANPQTYSHDTAYVGTDGCLYSGGTKVLTAHQTYTSVTGKPTADQEPLFGDTFTISQISQSTTGQITATDRSIRIPSSPVTTTSNGLATPAMLLAIQDIPTDDTLTIAAGQTSISTYHTVRSYIAYDASTYEEVVVDLEYGGNSRTFSIASAYTNDIKILIWG